MTNFLLAIRRVSASVSREVSADNHERDVMNMGGGMRQTTGDSCGSLAPLPKHSIIIKRSRRRGARSLKKPTPKGQIFNLRHQLRCAGAESPVATRNQVATYFFIFTTIFPFATHILNQVNREYHLILKWTPILVKRLMGGMPTSR